MGFVNILALLTEYTRFSIFLRQFVIFLFYTLSIFDHFSDEFFSFSNFTFFPWAFLTITLYLFLYIYLFRTTFYFSFFILCTLTIIFSHFFPILCQTIFLIFKWWLNLSNQSVKLHILWYEWQKIFTTHLIHRIAM